MAPPVGVVAAGAYSIDDAVNGYVCLPRRADKIGPPRVQRKIMWIVMNDSFLSIVRHQDKPDTLLVRARKAGEIEAVFPEAETREGEGTDYRFRADISAGRVAEAVAGRIKAIDYDNFKNSVSEKERHDAYMAVWERMWEWGQRLG